jgi:hypothetical protein
MILERVFSGTLAGAETIKLRPYPAPLPHLSSLSPRTLLSEVALIMIVITICFRSWSRD